MFLVLTLFSTHKANINLTVTKSQVAGRGMVPVFIPLAAASIYVQILFHPSAYYS